jgi:hypothetical protein
MLKLRELTGESRLNANSRGGRFVLLNTPFMRFELN